MHFNLAWIKGPKSVSSRTRKFPWQAWIALNFNTSRSPLRKKTSGSLLEHPASTAKRIRPLPKGITNFLSIFNFWKRETSIIYSWEGSKVNTILQNHYDSLGWSGNAEKQPAAFPGHHPVSYLAAKSLMNRIQFFRTDTLLHAFPIATRSSSFTEPWIQVF